MLRKKIILNSLASLVLACVSCVSEDENTQLHINTLPDTIEVLQGDFVTINVLENDTNVPTQGTLTISNPQNGIAEILNLNTSSDPSDDIVKYTPDTDFTGQDTFSYTICNDASPQSCSTETVTVTVLPISPVVFNLNEVPYQTLSEYHFFDGELNNLNPAYGVLPYDLNSPLFSDYAHKKRFVWMPSGLKADYIDDYSPLDFPTGSVLIKNFYYENIQPSNTTKIIETRLMYKTENGWDFAKYVWNDAQTEATFTNDGSYVNFEWIEDNTTRTVNYRIPSLNECFTCHNKFGTPLPIGPKPQNLNRSFNYGNGEENQLEKWISEGFLENNLPSNIVSTVKWDDDTLPLDLRARSYIDINCAHCHSEESYCEYRPMRFAFHENEDDTNIGICVTPDTQIAPYTKIIEPGNIDQSLLHFRISTTEEQYRMPLFGRTLKHEEGVRLIEDWINSLTNECE